MNVESELLSKNRDAFNRAVNLMRSLIVKNEAEAEAAESVETADAYDRYSYQEVYKYTNNFISFTLSNFYLDFTKDILYIEKMDSLVRRSVQTVLYNIITKLDVLLAPS